MENKNLLTTEERQKIADALIERIPNAQCPMCNQKKFSISEGYINLSLQSRLDRISLGGRSIPAIAAICENCGFVSQHALGALNLIPREGELGEE